MYPLILNTIGLCLTNSFEVYRLAKPSDFMNCGTASTEL